MSVKYIFEVNASECVEGVLIQIDGKTKHYNGFIMVNVDLCAVAAALKSC